MRSGAVKTLGAALLVGVAAAGCAAPATIAAPDLASWREARRELAALRDHWAPAVSKTLEVSLDFGFAGRHLAARGAVAVGEDALRMILLGPGGATALDLWICGDRFRYEVPALDQTRRGRVGEEGPGLPVAFLRRWFLGRLEGRLLSYADDPEGRRYVLRDGDDVAHLWGDERRLRARRGDDLIEATGAGCGEVRYRHLATDLAVDVVCERVGANPPPARAFADPDDPTRSCGGAT
ncbi:MAG: hypothetical protein R3B72_21875 [Polyangiaceae bacterium]